VCITITLFMTFFDCTADLVGQLKGMDRKEWYRLTHPRSKISGYYTDCKDH